MAHMHANAKRVGTSAITDDLTLIKGIGPTIATRLRSSGILTFAQLAELAPREISPLVVSRTASRIASENWKEQAEELATKTASNINHTNEPTKDIRQHYATFTVELLLDENRSVRRTRVAYVQKKSEETWAGWEQSKLENFIIQNAELKIPRLETIVSPMQPSGNSYKEALSNNKPNISFTGVLRANKLETTPLDSSMPHRILHANELFKTCIFLNFTEVMVSPTSLLNCIVTIWAKKLGKGERHIIGKQQSTFYPVEEISFGVETRISSPGLYHLEAQVIVNPDALPKSSSTTLRAWLESGPIQVY